MRVNLVVEDRQRVTSGRWRDLATAREHHGFEGLFRFDHDQSVTVARPGRVA